MKTVIAFDGNWYLHRVYYSINPNRDIGSALIYSFLSLILKDALSVRASNVLVAFDGPAVFRYSLYPQYKANRGEAKDGQPMREGFKDVYEYLPPLLSALTELQIPWIQPNTFEADDVLCSVAHKFKDHKVICATKDKDAYQYIGPHCTLYDSSHKVGGHFSPLIIDSKKVKAIKGVPPAQMAALQCLTGDKIDNIPKVLTPSKAKKLLTTYGTINNAIKTDESWATLLRPRLVDLKLNAKLVTLRTDVALPELNELVVPRINLDPQYKQTLPSKYFDYIDFIHPKAKGLFH